MRGWAQLAVKAPSLFLWRLRSRRLRGLWALWRGKVTTRRYQAASAGQWHDEKFFAFTSPPDLQALAPSSMILGGMVDEDEPESPPAPSEPAVDENDERRAATEAELRLTRTLEAAGLL